MSFIVKLSKETSNRRDVGITEDTSNGRDPSHSRDARYSRDVRKNCTAASGAPATEETSVSTGTVEIPGMRATAGTLDRAKTASVGTSATAPGQEKRQQYQGH